MNFFQIKNYNFDLTLQSGQSFVWNKINNIWYGSTIEALIKVSPSNDGFYWQTFPQNNNLELIKQYFRVNDDFELILNTLPNDEYLKNAYKAYPNLRLLRQNPEETTIAFIISANKNIPAIRSSIAKLSKLIGVKIVVDNIEFYLFPTMKAIAESNLDLLKSSSIGYRAPYIKESANTIINKNLFSNIHKLEVESQKQKLLNLKGVGNKVADCILLYGLGHNDITPIDIWAERFLKTYYNVNSRKYKDLKNWYQNYFNGYAGYGGQYLFEYIRNIDSKSSY